jgi:calcium-dependent protein kinase
MAPEVLQGRYTFHCDMWSFGVVMFIMLFGFPPFHGASDLIIHNKIAKGFHAQVKKGYGPYFPASIKVSDKARDLLGKLLHSDPAIRLTANEALSHPWFHSADKNPLAEAVLGGIQTFTANCQFKQAVLGALSTSLTADELRDLKDSFKKMDLNGDGVVTVDELKQALQREEEQGEESKIAQSMVKLMEMADVDGDGALSYEELVMASVQQRLLAKEERLYNTFCQLDQDRNGTVTAEEIEQVLGEQDDVKQMIAEIDKDGDGQISYAEFVAMFTAKESAAEMKAMDLEKPSTTTA